MAMQSNVYRGVVHGKTIELDDETGLQDGQQVKIIIQAVSGAEGLIGRLPPGEGIRRSAGAWADDAEELDKYLEWNRQQRKVGRPPIQDWLNP
jgi:hypothetical protein